MGAPYGPPPSNLRLYSYNCSEMNRFIIRIQIHAIYELVTLIIEEVENWGAAERNPPTSPLKSILPRLPCFSLPNNTIKLLCESSEPANFHNYSSIINDVISL